MGNTSYRDAAAYATRIDGVLLVTAVLGTVFELVRRRNPFSPRGSQDIVYRKSTT
jgi:hypothetical protein